MRYIFKIEIEAVDRDLIPPTLEHVARIMSEHKYYIGQRSPNAVKYDWSLKSDEEEKNFEGEA